MRRCGAGPAGPSPGGRLLPGHRGRCSGQADREVGRVDLPPSRRVPNQPDAVAVNPTVSTEAGIVTPSSGTAASPITAPRPRAGAVSINHARAGEQSSQRPGQHRERPIPVAICPLAQLHRCHPSDHSPCALRQKLREQSHCWRRPSLPSSSPGVTRRPMAARAGRAHGVAASAGTGATAAGSAAGAGPPAFGFGVPTKTLSCSCTATKNSGVNSPTGTSKSCLVLACS